MTHVLSPLGSAIVTVAILHYIYDPLCGWCYGAAPLLTIARDISELSIEMHAGGMCVGNDRRPVTPKVRDYVLRHDQRIAAVTGQVFGEAYLSELLFDESETLDSEPPTTAILAAQAMSSDGLEMLKRIQIAHFIDGRRISRRATLIDIAAKMGLDPNEFGASCDLFRGEFTMNHIEETRRLMYSVGATGFPTFLLAVKNGFHYLDSSRYMARAREWRDYLLERMASDPPVGDTL